MLAMMLSLGHAVLGLLLSLVVSVAIAAAMLTMLTTGSIAVALMTVVVTASVLLSGRLVRLHGLLGGHSVHWLLMGGRSGGGSVVLLLVRHEEDEVLDLVGVLVYLSPHEVPRERSMVHRLPNDRS